MNVSTHGKNRGVKLRADERRRLDDALAVLSGLEGGWAMLGEKIGSDEAGAAWRAVKIVVDRLDGRGAKVG